MITRGVNENLTLNGSLSYDPESGDNKGMNFTWHYVNIRAQNYSSSGLLEEGSLPSTNMSNAQYLGNGTGHVIVIDLEFLHDSDTIIVNLTVAKDYRVSSVLQIVSLVQDPPPKIAQR